MNDAIFSVSVQVINIGTISILGSLWMLQIPSQRSFIFFGCMFNHRNNRLFRSSVSKCLEKVPFQFYTMQGLINITTNSVQDSLFPHLCHHLLSSVFSITFNIIVKWAYINELISEILTVVLICISFMTTHVEYILIFLKLLYFPLSWHIYFVNFQYSSFADFNRQHSFTSATFKLTFVSSLIM